MLDNEIEDAISIIKNYEIQDKFLEELALYIKDRNK